LKTIKNEHYIRFIILFSSTAASATSTPPATTYLISITQTYIGSFDSHAQS